MKICITFFLTCWMVFAFHSAHAQSAGAKISGVIRDNNKKPADRATVILLNAGDSAKIKTMLTHPNGSFDFENLKPDTYSIRVTFVGYKEYRSAPLVITKPGLTELPVIVLVQDNATLKVVAVTAQKPFIEQKPDRTVVNVGALLSNTGTSALEVLEKTPGVVVDVNGNIIYKGKSGVLIMIDNKPTYLSAANLATYLRSLPSSSLDQIELMDNPPARYDAAGNGGVINIKIKKNIIKGFNAALSVNYVQGFYERTNESVNMNYRVNKINVFANASYNYNRTFRSLETNRENFDGNGNKLSSFKDESYFRPANNNYNLKTGVDYFVSPKTTWGIVFTGGLSLGDDKSPVYSSLYDKNGLTDSTINTWNTTKRTFKNGGINLNYTHQYDNAGRSLTFDLDYIRNSYGTDQTFLNDTYNPLGNLLTSQTLTADLPGTIHIYSAKTDYSKPLKGKAKFETGLKSSYVNTDNGANYFNVINKVSTIDYNHTNHFLYKENINAAYVNFSKPYKRFALQTGLRAENTNGYGHQLGNVQRPDSSFAKHYLNLFPTAYLSYKLDTAGKHTMVVSYGRRIGRPSYASLNPFITIVDKFTYFSGNPFLKPQFTNNYKVSYNYKSLISATFTYSNILDVQTETIYKNGDIFISTTGNIGKNKTLDFSVNSNLQPAKWWTANLYAEVYHSTYKGKVVGGYLDQSGNTFSFNGNNQFNLGKGWLAEVSGTYNSSGVYGQFITVPSGTLNAGLQKKVMNNKGTVRLNARDILHTTRSSGVITRVANATATYRNYIDSRVVILAFTYNFGKSLNNPRKRSTGGAESEQSRANH